jgi:hypothetical protein
MMEKLRLFQLILVITCWLIDSVLLILIRRNNINLKNSYYAFHEKYGLFKVSILKLTIILFSIDALLDGTSRAGILAAITYYCIVIVKLSRDYVSQRSNKGAVSI